VIPPPTRRFEMGVWTFDMENGEEDDAGVTCPAAVVGEEGEDAVERAPLAGFVVVAVPDGEGGLRLALQPVAS
jgi:hypothetical protein